MFEIKDKKFKVERIVYYNDKNSWGVLGTAPLEPLGDAEIELLNMYGNISISGNFGGVYEGCEIQVTGDIISNSKFGKQIQIRTIKVLEDVKSKEGVINFLARSMIRGISVQNAKKIYEKFKDKSITTVLDNAEQLLTIHGIGQRTVNKIKASAVLYKAMKPLAEFCTELGLNYGLIMKLHEELGAEALSIIRVDPYRILEVSEVITFKQADEIYIKNGGNPTGRRRLEVGLLYTLKHLVTMEGSTGCLSDVLKKRFYKLLELSDITNSYDKILEKLEGENKVLIDEKDRLGKVVYYKEYSDVEKSISEKVGYLNTYGIPSDKIKEEIVEEEINNFPFTLNEQQVKAIKECLNKPVSVITGSAGTGKSSITKALYNIYGRCGVRTALIAPTAKAAIRLSECTGGYASTIHRFLGMGIDVPFEEIESIAAAKLDNTVIIIDEASMLDILLFNKLLDTAGPTTKFILVGDNNQLPSVQAGNVLGDLIKSFRVPTAILTDVMRQGRDSHIIKYCNMINNGEIFEPCEVSDFHYEEFGEADELREVLVKHYSQDVKKYGLQEVQVITPYKKGELGMNNLNLLLQKTYNVAGMDLTETYKLGDRVRHTVNNYKKGVFNGETGVICDFNAEDNCIIVDYGDRQVSYETTDLYELALSYCSTVHASQGSEYKVCYVILDDTAVNDYLFIRRLLYTAVSRGKEKVYIFSKPYLLDKCITNASYKPRITKLSEFLQTVSVIPYA